MEFFWVFLTGRLIKGDRLKEVQLYISRRRDSSS